MPGRAGSRITTDKYGQIVAELKKGKPMAEVARIVDVNVSTVQRYAHDPVLAADLKTIRENIKKLHLVRGARLQDKAWDLAEAQTGRKGDPRGFKEAMQGIQAMEDVTAKASGESQKLDISGHVNVDVRAILAQVFGHGAVVDAPKETR